MIYVSFDMILGAYLLGNIAALVVKGSKTEKFRDKMADLIKYMNKHKLDRQTSKEIKGHLRLQYERSNTEVALLQDVPASIRTKVLKKFYLPIHHQFSTFFLACGMLDINIWLTTYYLKILGLKFL